MEKRTIKTWHLLVTFLFPALYFLNAMTPWAVRLWGGGDRGSYISYWIGVCVLHWISAGLVLRFLKKDGLSLRDIGYNLRKKGNLILAGSLLAFALAVFFLTESIAPAEVKVEAGLMSMFYPLTTGERLFWILCCFTAGFCEELVYRGYNISMLRYKGVNKWVAMLIAVFPFILIHSFAPIYSGYLFGVYFSAGIIFGLIFLLTKRLWIPMAIHCAYNLTAMMAVLGQ
ncbi:MAG: CPBP family intramembrane metalloprotease [Rikenellaceae bacterium]|nr:CPBP family intramembrane metalloprotease [Rikenellaceae bacterium]